jgi:diacylglycerol kinase family enzyme
MRFRAILNQDGGTLKDTDIEKFSTLIVESFQENGHSVDVRPVKGENLIEALENAFGDGDVDGVIAGGGDGTVSAAGGMALEAGKPLAILPAGTMNLYARALNIPLDLDEAVRALAAGEVGQSDIGRANGRAFLHQFTIGFHSRMIAERNSYNFASKIGKIRASIVAAFDTIRRPPSFPVEMDIDGRKIRERVSSVAVSNNLFGEGHLPYADDVSGGTLGIYYAKPATVAANAKMLADLTIGNWRNNLDIIRDSGKRVTLDFPQRRKSAKAVIDGELVDLDSSVEIEILPGALKVMLPAKEST